MIAVLFALEFECARFHARHDPRLRVAVWIFGVMGEAVAEALRRRLAQNRPTLVISAGFAGGLQEGLVAGDLVLGRNFSDPDLVRALKLGQNWHIGDVTTEAAIIERGEDKRALGARTGALAGDLETAHLHAVCREHGIPMLSVRSISDAVDDDMPVPARVLLNPETGRPESLQLFRHLIANPSAVPKFNRLVKNARTAQASLAKGLEEILPQVLRAT